MHYENYRKIVIDNVLLRILIEEVAKYENTSDASPNLNSCLKKINDIRNYKY
jgi:hypothetical protein